MRDRLEPDACGARANSDDHKSDEQHGSRDQSKDAEGAATSQQGATMKAGEGHGLFDDG